MGKSKETKFRDKISRLEEIASSLEDTTLDLEDALKLYEEGMILAKECTEQLKGAELKITELKNKLLNDIAN
ncbi:MAG: exodeoxyribonuclease VII small subunit [Ignavibacteriaceae bacterium]|nr:exodeoxyribonuclease VII small subunit [Ignavibacteriaceae bacterium]